ncbi:lysozyme [Pectobacterium brasiliense]|uniref:lysozyme n=1 Tax=Pectobacterium brasiliense TaxID=180957 RepID=UPI0030158E4C
MLPEALKQRIIPVVTACALAIATVFIGFFEGKENAAYRDIAGVWTICYGHTGDVKAGDYKTDAECEALLQQDLKPAFNAIDRLVTVPLSELQRAALASFIYNVGTGEFERSTLLRKLNRGDLTGACNELRRWNKAAGQVWQGLTNRREAERVLCLEKL